MDINTILLTLLIPADIVMLSVLIAGVIEFRKSVDFEKLIEKQNRER